MPSDVQRSRACRALVKPPNLLIFQIHDIHRSVGMASEQHREVIDVFVHHERMVGTSTNREAFLIGFTRAARYRRRHPQLLARRAPLRA